MTAHRHGTTIPLWPLVWIMIGWMTGCAASQPLPPLELFFPCVSPESIARECFISEEALLEKQSPHAQADHLWKLALLYAHPDNPHPNYPKAAERMEALADLLPDGWQSARARYMAALFSIFGRTASELEALRIQIPDLVAGHKKALSEMVREREAVKKKARTQSTHLKSELDRLRKRNEELEQQVRSLEEKLETLKHLELQIEERKRF